MELGLLLHLLETFRGCPYMVESVACLGVGRVRGNQLSKKKSADCCGGRASGWVGITKGGGKPGSSWCVKVWRRVQKHGIVGMNKMVFARSCVDVVHLFAGPDARMHAMKIWGSSTRQENAQTRSPIPQNKLRIKVLG